MQSLHEISQFPQGTQLLRVKDSQIPALLSEKGGKLALASAMDNSGSLCDFGHAPDSLRGCTRLILKLNSLAHTKSSIKAVRILSTTRHFL